MGAIEGNEDMSTTTQQAVALDALDDCENNPNVMGDKDVATLAAAIGKFGNLQPILVIPTVDGRYRIVDGHHRSKAARAAGRTVVDAVVLPIDYPPEDERMLRISMNRLRGELDLGVVAEVLASMVASGASVDDLLLSGYSADEIDALLRVSTVDPAGDDLMGQSMGSTEPANDATAFVLEVPFESKADMAKAKRALRRAAAGAPLGTGLLALIEGD